MSFYTVLHFYRPRTPPVITGAALAKFVRAVDRLHVSEVKYPQTVQVKFGKAIDQDEEPSTWSEQVNRGICVSKEIEWDVAIQCESLRAVSEGLVSHNRPVYRAFIELGSATTDIFQHLARVNSPENNVDLTLDSWSLEIGPVISAALDSEVQFHIGWISVNLSGYGYLYPWTPAELVERAEKHSGIRQVMELCKKTWPVEPKRPDLHHTKMREQMGDLWPYSEIDVPWDWYWGIG
jgi:hypothetical protein